LKRVCPRCASAICRIRRRFVDRLISRFVSIQRFRCESIHCVWEGNLRIAAVERPGADHSATPGK